MLDNALIALIISAAIAGEAAAGISGTPIKQAFQPTNQGVNTTPTAYLYKVNDERVGNIYRNDTWDAVHSVMVHTETQMYATTFQLSTLSTQDPTNTTQLTASDLCNLFAAILQSSVCIATLEASGVGLQHIGAIRNGYFSDDRSRNEANPSFDFTLTHPQTIITNSPIISRTIYNIDVV